MLGAHFTAYKHQSCVRFAVWAPHALAVSVVGDFNNWDAGANPMELSSSDGEIWVTHIPGLQEGDIYKYAITGADGSQILKSDPYAFSSEVRPNTASRLTKLHYTWRDRKWMDSRQDYDSYSRPMLTYEVHLGSWKRNAEGEMLTYRELAEQLVAYVMTHIHYTHIELMPLCEYPFDGSLGLPGNGLFLRNQPLRLARGFHVLRRPVPPQRHWCYPRLAYQAISPRCPRPAPL